MTNADATQQRGARLSYAEQLRHPKWQERRLRVLERAGFTCEWCRDQDTTLHVHHKRYRKGALAWDYDLSELVCLCETCHAAVTQWNAELSDMMAGMDHQQWQMILGYVECIKKIWECSNLSAKDKRRWEFPVRLDEWRQPGIAHAFGFSHEIEDALSALPPGSQVPLWKFERLRKRIGAERVSGSV